MSWLLVFFCVWLCVCVMNDVKEFQMRAFGWKGRCWFYPKIQFWSCSHSLLMGPVLSRNETKQCMHNVSRHFRSSSAQPWWWRRCWSLICKIHLRYARESRAYPGDLRADQFGRNLIITMQSRFQTVSWAHRDDQPEDEMTLMDKYWIADSCWQKYVICDFTFNFVSRKKWSMLADVFFLPFAYKQTHLLSFQLLLLSTGHISQRTVCMIPGSMAAPTFNLCEVKKYEHGSETSGRGRKFWLLHPVRISLGISRVLINDHLLGRK